MNDPFCGWMDWQMSPFMHLEKYRGLNRIFTNDGLVICLPWEQATCENSFNLRIFWVFNG